MRIEYKRVNQRSEWALWMVLSIRVDIDLTMKMWWQLKSAWESFQHLLFSLRWKVPENFFLFLLSPFIHSLPLISIFCLYLPFSLALFLFNLVLYVPTRKKKNGIRRIFFPIFTFRYSTSRLRSKSVVCGRWNGSNYIYWIGKYFGVEVDQATATRQQRMLKKICICKEADKLFSRHCSPKLFKKALTCC